MEFRARNSLAVVVWDKAIHSLLFFVAGADLLPNGCKPSNGGWHIDPSFTNLWDRPPNRSTCRRHAPCDAGLSASALGSKGTSTTYLCCCYWAATKLLKIMSNAGQCWHFSIASVSKYIWLQGWHPASFAYLGLPLGTTRPSVQDLTPILDQIERRLNASARFLDYGGRLQLVNSVLSSLPNHYLSSLKVHKTIIKIADLSRRLCLWAKEEGSSIICEFICSIVVGV
jgi:hypothetical protein